MWADFGFASVFCESGLGLFRKARFDNETQDGNEESQQKPFKHPSVFESRDRKGQKSTDYATTQNAQQSVVDIAS
jgi:hypothetical protein